jgi:hypothetical protein
MSKIDYAMLRDRVIDFLCESCPRLLDDEYLAERVMYLVFCEVRRALRAQRERLLAQIGCPR